MSEQRSTTDFLYSGINSSGIDVQWNIKLKALMIMSLTKQITRDK